MTDIKNFENTNQRDPINYCYCPCGIIIIIIINELGKCIVLFMYMYQKLMTLIMIIIDERCHFYDVLLCTCMYTVYNVMHCTTLLYKHAVYHCWCMTSSVINRGQLERSIANTLKLNCFQR